jgi:hypothetical protein
MELLLLLLLLRCCCDFIYLSFPPAFFENSATHPTTVKQHCATPALCGLSSGKRRSKLPMPGGPVLPEQPPLFAPLSSRRSRCLSHLLHHTHNLASPLSTSRALPLQLHSLPPLSLADAPPSAPDPPHSLSAAVKRLPGSNRSRQPPSFADIFLIHLLIPHRLRWALRSLALCSCWAGLAAARARRFSQ